MDSCALTTATFAPILAVMRSIFLCADTLSRRLLAPCLGVGMFVIAACNTESDDIALGNTVTLPGDDDDDDVSSSSGYSSSGKGGGSSGGSTSGNVASSSGAGGSSSGGSSGEEPLPGEDLSGEYSGKATYYNVDVGDMGNCSLPCPSSYLVGALNTADYDGSALCGGCAEVTGPKGSVIVSIWDRCPGCGTHGIDLSYTAFGKVANHSAGRVDVSWKLVRCPSNTPMTYQIYSDRVQIRNHREPIESVQVTQNGQTKTLNRRSDNFFTGAIADRELKLTITGMTGAVVEETLPGRGTGQVGTEQFD